MSTKYLQRGKSLTVTAPEAKDEGAGIELGDRAGICLHAADNAASLEVGLEGVYQMVKESGDGPYVVGTKLYWDDADDNVQDTADTATNKPLGWAAAAAATGDTTVQVKLGAW
jgi:predicted RecA/RadA family phage recombinase